MRKLTRRRRAGIGVVAAAAVFGGVFAVRAAGGERDLPGSPPDGEAVALRLAQAYGDLVATAIRHRVSDAAVRAAGIEPGTPGVRGLLDYYGCVKDELDYPATGGEGYAFLLSYRGMGPDELRAAAILGARFGDVEPPVADRHILGFGLRDGRWRIVEDIVDNGGIHGVEDEKSLTPWHVREPWEAIGSHEKAPWVRVPHTPPPAPADGSSVDDFSDLPGPCGWGP